MKEIRYIFNRTGYKLSDKFFIENENDYFVWQGVIDKYNFNMIKIIDHEKRIFIDEKNKYEKEKNIILEEEAEGNKIKLLILIEIIFKIKILEKKISELELAKNKIKKISAKTGKLGGRPVKDSEQFVYKTNGLITNQLNSHILIKYNKKMKPDIFKEFSQEEICNIINAHTFYHFSSQYPFLEDAILALASHHEHKEIKNEFFIYTLQLNEFIKESGAKGPKKNQFINFLQSTFSGEKFLKFPTVSIENGKLALPRKTGHSVKLIADNKFNGVNNETETKVRQTI